MTPAEHTAKQQQLAATYLRARAEQEATGAPMSHDGQAALAGLLAALEGLITVEFNAQCRNRYGRLRKDLLRDALQEAALAVCDALPQYDESRSLVKTFLIYRKNSPVQEALQRVIAADAGALSGLSRAQEDVSRWLVAANTAARAQGQSLSVAELTQAVAAERRAQRAETLLASGRDPAHVDALVDAAFTKEGLTAAFAGARELFSVKTTAPVADLTDPVVTTYAQPLEPPAETDPVAAALADVAMCGLAGADRERMWATLFDPLTADGRVTGRAGRNRARQDALARLAAPHAHFSVLSPTLGSQFT